MKILVKIKYGSHLYGTTTQASDLDIKGIFIPNARDILLQRIPPVVSEKRTKAHGEKNTADDIDYELYSPQKYLSLLAQGQTVALDMLFAPESAILGAPHPQWAVIKALAHRILTKQAASFVHYCKQQANKYSAKGGRVAAARLALQALTEAESIHGASSKLICALDTLKQLADNNEFIVMGCHILANGHEELYFEVCGKKALLNAPIKAACLMAKKIIDEYGQRALAAERNEGVDWKALSHAVRIGHQAIEFFRTNHITFPRPEATHLIAIKQGIVDFQKVAEEIEHLVAEVDAAAEQSTLPETYDHKIVEDFLEQLHLEQVSKEF